MARTHEEGRFRKPAHWATEVRAVHAQNQEPCVSALVRSLIPHIDGRVSHDAVPRLTDRIVECHAARLVFGKITHCSQVDPLHRRLSGPEDIREDRNTYDRGRHGRQPRRDPAKRRDAVVEPASPFEAHATRVFPCQQFSNSIRPTRACREARDGNPADGTVASGRGRLRLAEMSNESNEFVDFCRGQRTVVVIPPFFLGVGWHSEIGAAR